MSRILQIHADPTRTPRGTRETSAAEQTFRTSMLPRHFPGREGPARGAMRMASWSQPAGPAGLPRHWETDETARAGPRRDDSLERELKCARSVEAPGASDKPVHRGAWAMELVSRIKQPSLLIGGQAAVKHDRPRGWDTQRSMAWRRGARDEAERSTGGRASAPSSVMNPGECGRWCVGQTGRGAHVGASPGFIGGWRAGGGRSPLREGLRESSREQVWTSEEIGAR